MLAGMIFNTEPFFRGADNDDQLIKIAKVLGTEDVHKYVEKFPNIILSPYFKQNLINYKKKEWSKYAASVDSQSIADNDDAFDLLT